MDAIKKFFTDSVSIAGAEIPNWGFIVAAIILLAVIVIIACDTAAQNKKAKAAKANKAEGAKAEPAEEPATEPAEEKAEEPQKEEPVEQPVAEEPEEEKVEEPEEEKAEEPVTEEPVAEEEKTEEPIAEEEKAEEKAEEIPEEKPEEIEEKAEEPVEEAPVVEEEKAEEPVETVAEEKAEETAAEEKTEEPEEAAPADKEEKAEEPAEEPAEEEKAEEQKKPAEKAKTTKKGVKSEPMKKESKPTASESRRGKGADEVFGKGVVAEPAKKPAEKKPAEKKPAEKKPAGKEVAATVESKKAIGKFEICNSNIGGFRYLLSANNGQLLYESRDYKTFDGCKEAIDKFINAVKAGDFRVRGDKFGNFKFNLKSPTSNNVVFVGESYDAKKKCENAVESVKRFAESAKIVDITEADFVVTSAAFDIPADVKKEVAGGKGATGRWEVTTADDEANSPYVFLLYANNGQLLYESRDYKSADNAKSGLDTFVKTVKDGEFIVDSDKFGRYRFILRKAGNQVEYIGQNYNDKQSAIRSAISVYKFALLTPVELN